MHPRTVARVVSAVELAAVALVLFSARDDLLYVALHNRTMTVRDHPVAALGDGLAQLAAGFAVTFAVLEGVPALATLAGVRWPSILLRVPVGLLTAGGAVLLARRALEPDPIGIGVSPWAAALAGALCAGHWVAIVALARSRAAPG